MDCTGCLSVGVVDEESAKSTARGISEGPRLCAEVGSSEGSGLCSRCSVFAKCSSLSGLQGHSPCLQNSVVRIFRVLA